MENVIRFLEDWQIVDFYYKGSLVSLWHSQQATGRWHSGYYRPPVRHWEYDPLFDTTPPPGSFSGVQLVRGQWSSGGY